MAIKPITKAPTEKHLRPSHEYHCETEDGCEMEKVEVSRQVVNAEGGQIETDHRSTVKRAHTPVPPGALGVQKNECPQYEADCGESNMSEWEHRLLSSELTANFAA